MTYTPIASVVPSEDAEKYKVENGNPGQVTTPTAPTRQTAQVSSAKSTPSAADQANMNSAELAILQQLKDQYNPLTQQTPTQQVTAPQQVGSVAKGQVSADAKKAEMNALLESWRDAAAAQAEKQVDYSVNQAVTELERALADAQPQFKEQAESVALDERQGMDNSALYAELRGDKGGIGQSQYNEIQAAAAQNRLAVQQAQTKLSTDTARQIADLRAQGEFEKADAALELSQQYLSQLMSLEQWAAEYGLNLAQFEESLRQWEAEYNAAMEQFKVDTDLSYKQLAMSEKNQLAGVAEALLGAGIPLTEEQRAALDMTEEQATAYAMAAQLAAAGSGSSGGSSSGGQKDVADMTDAEIYKYLYDSGYKNVNESSVKAHLQSLGLSASLAGAIADAYANGEYSALRTGDIQGQQGEDDTVVVPEFGKVSYEDAMALFDAGYLTITGYANDKPVFARTSMKFMPEVPVAKG